MNAPSDTSLSDLVIPRNEIPAEEDLVSGKVRMISKISFASGEIELREDSKTNTQMIVAAPGDLVISGINAHQGAIALYDPNADQAAAATIHYSAYEIRRDRIRPRLLWYLLRSPIFKDRISRALPGGIKSELTPERFLRITVPVPSVECQDSLLATIETLAERIARVRRLRAQSEELRSRVMPSALEKIFGRFTETRPFGEVISFKPRSGPSFPTDPEWTGTPVLMPSAVTGFGVDLTRVEFGLGDETVSELDRLGANDILIARGNKADQVGNAGVVPAEANRWVAANLLMKCRVDPTAADPHFCVYWLRSPRMRAHVKRTMKGTNPNIQKINQRNVLAFAFPAKVTVEEQRFFVDHLDSVQRKLDRLRKLQDETAAEVRMLLPGMLAAVFNGHL